MIKVKKTEWKKWNELKIEEKVEVLLHLHKHDKNFSAFLTGIIIIVFGMSLASLSILSHTERLSSIFIILMGGILCLFSLIIDILLDKKYQPFFDSLKKQVEVKY